MALDYESTVPLPTDVARKRSVRLLIIASILLLLKAVDFFGLNIVLMIELPVSWHSLAMHWSFPVTSLSDWFRILMQDWTGLLFLAVIITLLLMLAIYVKRKQRWAVRTSIVVSGLLSIFFGLGMVVGGILFCMTILTGTGGPSDLCTISLLPMGVLLGLGGTLVLATLYLWQIRHEPRLTAKPCVSTASTNNAA